MARRCRRVLLFGQIGGLAVAFASAGVAAAATKPHPQPVRETLSAKLSSSWRTWWGSAAGSGGAVTLSSAVPTSAGETHSALMTTRRTWSDPTISFATTTLAQLRAGSAPNFWEVGWVMFRFRDLANYYYFILKPNGFELGKKHGSDAQIFLATGDLPGLQLGRSTRIKVRTEGARIRVSVDGVQVVDFTDPHPLLGAGAVGLYEEDSRVRFDSVSIA